MKVDGKKETGCINWYIIDNLMDTILLLFQFLEAAEFVRNKILSYKHFVKPYNKDSAFQ